MTHRYAVLMLFLTASTQGGLRVRQILQVPLEPLQGLSSVATDRNGNFLVTGDNNQGGFVQKLDSSGNVVFSHFVFGFFPSGAVADANGDVYWIGAGGDLLNVFPFTNSILGITHPPFSSGFVAKFNGQDGSIIWAIELGALQPSAIAVDDTGQVTIAGSATVLGGVTTTGAYSSTTIGMNYPIEIVRLTADGNPLFAAAYGGQSVQGGTSQACEPSELSFDPTCPRTYANALLTDLQGRIWLSGSTNTSDVPVTSDAPYTQCQCDSKSAKGFLAELSGDGSKLAFATFLPDSVQTAAMDRAGNIWTVANTSIAGLPVTPDAIQPQLQGKVDGYVLEYDPVSNRILFATYYGTASTNYLTNIAIDSSGNVLLAGRLFGPIGLPDTGPDFVASLSATGSDILTFPSEATGSGLALMPSGSLAVGGAVGLVTVVENSSDTSPSISAVSNNARVVASGQVSPGEIISIFGTNMGPAEAAIASATAGQTLLPTDLSGVQVLFDGVAAPLLSVAGDRIQAVAPFGIAAKTATTLAVSKAGVLSNTAQLGVVSATPGIFTTQDEHSGYSVAAALNEDGSVNSATNGAAPGSVVTIFATGLGTLTPQPPDGIILTGSNLPALPATLWVASGVETLDILYAGPAPGQVAGAMQLNVRLPADATDPLPIILFANTWTSQYFTVWLSGN